MGVYWDAIDEERSIIQARYKDNSEMYDLAIMAWESAMATQYFYQFHEKSTYVVMYKTQADVALMRAITSILCQEYSQAVYNIRLATENLTIAIFAYSRPDDMSLIMSSDDIGGMDRKIKKAAINFLASVSLERSERFKGLHRACDQYGAHQTLSHHKGYFTINGTDRQFQISLRAEPKLELDVGLTGIVIGSILEFHYAIFALGPVEWLKVASGAPVIMKDISDGLQLMKAKYRYLYSV